MIHEWITQSTDKQIVHNFFFNRSDSKQWFIHKQYSSNRWVLSQNMSIKIFKKWFMVKVYYGQTAKKYNYLTSCCYTERVNHSWVNLSVDS